MEGVGDIEAIDYFGGKAVCLWRRRGNQLRGGKNEGGEISGIIAYREGMTCSLSAFATACDFE